MKKIEVISEFCPICDRAYEKAENYKHRNVRTKHHVFPQFWYKEKKHIFIYACSFCHTFGFHAMFPMGKRVWRTSECIHKWVYFCRSKGKDAYKIYPILREL